VSFERKKIVTASNAKRRKTVAKKPVKAKRKSLQKRKGVTASRKKKKSVLFTQRIRNVVLFLVIFFILS